jgi:hypothetical protein
MRELHDRLTERYPCISVDESGPWSDGPLINNFGYNIAVIGLSHSRAHEVVPFIIEAASAMGLSVLDDQDGSLIRPGQAHVIKRDASPAKWWQVWKRR